MAAEPDSSAAIDALGAQHERAMGNVRIVSLVPSLTELLFTLGLGDQVVGRTGFCVHPKPAIRTVAKVGGTKDVKLERVRDLAPTHVVVNIDENRRETVEILRDFVPHVIVTHPLTADDNLHLYRMFGHIFDRESQGQALARDFAVSRQALLDAARRWPRENALYLIWRDPWLSISRATYISSMLALAGWDTLPRDAAQRYPEVTQSDWADAAIVLLSSEPYAFRAKDVTALSAARKTRAVLIDGEMISWYGSRAIHGLDYLREFRARLDARD